MVIRSINNNDTTKMGTKEVAALLKADVPSLTILAQTTKEVAMGRASFRSMRSLTSARSLGESISSGVSAGADPSTLEGKEITTTKKVASEEPVVETKGEETITVLSGGKASSLTVKNVVDC